VAVLFYFDGSADGGVEVVGSLFAGTGPGAQVIYSPPDRAAGTPDPAGVPLYRRMELAAEPVLTWATWEHPRLYAGRGRPTDGWDAVYGAAAEVTEHLQPGPAHQLGGNPLPVQGPVEVEIAYGQVSRGRLEKIAWIDPAVLSAADNWVLLAQFDSDDQAGFMWGDCGMLYYLIRPADLAARRFDRAAFTWQCS